MNHHHQPDDFNYVPTISSFFLYYIPSYCRSCVSCVGLHMEKNTHNRMTLDVTRIPIGILILVQVPHEHIF